MSLSDSLVATFSALLVAFSFLLWRANVALAKLQSDFQEWQRKHVIAKDDPQLNIVGCASCSGEYFEKEAIGVGTVRFLVSNPGEATASIRGVGVACPGYPCGDQSWDWIWKSIHPLLQEYGPLTVQEDGFYGLRDQPLPGLVFGGGLTRIEGSSRMLTASIAEKMRAGKNVKVTLTYRIGQYGEKSSTYPIAVCG